MDQKNHLKKAEEKWLFLSFEFLKRKFEESPLPSHDHYHHLRVWNHAQFLVLELIKQGFEIDYEFSESLSLACLFHDSGMIKERGNDHGRAGVEIFEEFLSTTELEPVNKNMVIDAIEKHDNKSYQLAGKLTVDGKIMLLPCLQISDDLDAMGYIGIYRYCEIYLLRGIPFEDLGLKIIANLSGRYGNFMANCSQMPEIIKIHSIRHHIIETFFRTYNLQIRKFEETGEEQTSGPLAVVKAIYKEVMKNTPSIEDIASNAVDSTEDRYIKNYFRELINEIMKLNHYCL